MPNLKIFKLNKAFTLIEVLTVIAIISVLAGIGVARFDSARDKGRDAKRKGDVQAMRTALSAYYLDHDAYPGSCAASCTDYEQYASDGGTDWGLPGLSPEYIKAPPKDPKQAKLLDTLLAAIKKGPSQIAQNLLAMLPKFKKGPAQENNKAINTHPEVAASTTAKSPTLATAVAGGTQTWTSITNVYSSNNIYATSVGTALNQTTQYIQATGFGFTIAEVPDTATITGFRAIAEGKSSVANQAWTNAMNMVKAGVISGSICNSACNSGNAFGTTDQTWGYGADGITGGGTWTPADVRAANFGVAFQGKFGAAATLSIDYISLTVYYTLPAPTVTTTSPTLVTNTSATLNGSANPNGYTTTGWFRYSSTLQTTCDDTFGTRIPTTSGTALGSGSTVLTYSQGPTGLTPNTTYYYCAIASSANGTSFGSVVNFLTLPTFPAVTTNLQSSVTSSTATLNGTVNPNGGTTNGWFRWGASNLACTSLPTVTTSQALGSGSVNVALSQAISGLSASTLYYYCAAASNISGTNYGTVLSFTTSAAAVAPTCNAIPSSGQSSISSTLTASGGNGTYSWSVAPAGATINPTTGTSTTLTSSTVNNYTVTVTSNSQTGTCSVTVTAAPSVSITASPSTMPWTWGGSGTISWIGTGVSSCSVPGVGTAGPSGSGTVGPLTTTTTYTVTCDSGTPTNSTTVTVGAPPAYLSSCVDKDYIYCYVVSPDHLHFFLYAKLDRPTADDAIVAGSPCETNKPSTTAPGKKPFNFCVEDPK